jgi:hypothetical protein
MYRQTVSKSNMRAIEAALPPSPEQNGCLFERGKHLLKLSELNA